MRFLTADYLFPLDQRPIKNGVLQITDKGEVVQIFKNRDDFFTNYAFSTVSLIKNCKENGLIIEGEDMYDRKKILKNLMII